MAEFTSYPAGTPCWVDLGSPDLEASKAFYTGLFGWTANTVPGPEAGGYTLFTLRDKLVAGLGPLFGEGQPAAWSTYVGVDDADATADKVEDAGGQIQAKPMDVMTAGRMAVFRDTAGAAISVWQPGDIKGAQLANEPNAFCWSELDTRDITGSMAFYPAVFGWSIGDSSGPDSPIEYYEWKNGDKTIAGMTPMPEQVPPPVPSFWLTYFAVDDTDAAITRARELGGAVMTGPIDIPAGRFAVMSGPHGEAFGLIKM